MSKSNVRSSFYFLFHILSLFGGAMLFLHSTVTQASATSLLFAGQVKCNDEAGTVLSGCSVLVTFFQNDANGQRINQQPGEFAKTDGNGYFAVHLGNVMGDELIVDWL